MKRRMKLLLADIFIGALTLIFGGPLFWICMADFCKTTVLRSPRLERFIMRPNRGSPKCRKTIWGKNKREGEQLI
jgi:hypothetical protein